MNKDKISEYIKAGGALFHITNMDMLKDGGTYMIETRAGMGFSTFYIEQENKTIHTHWPTSEENLLIDELTKEYLIMEIRRYIAWKQRWLERDKECLASIESKSNE